MLFDDNAVVARSALVVLLLLLLIRVFPCDAKSFNVGIKYDEQIIIVMHIYPIQDKLSHIQMICCSCNIDIFCKGEKEECSDDDDDEIQ